MDNRKNNYKCRYVHLSFITGGMLNLFTVFCFPVKSFLRCQKTFQEAAEWYKHEWSQAEYVKCLSTEVWDLNSHQCQHQSIRTQLSSASCQSNLTTMKLSLCGFCLLPLLHSAPWVTCYHLFLLPVNSCHCLLSAAILIQDGSLGFRSVLLGPARRGHVVQLQIIQNMRVCQSNTSYKSGVKSTWWEPLLDIFSSITGSNNSQNSS